MNLRTGVFMAWGLVGISLPLLAQDQTEQPVAEQQPEATPQPEAAVQAEAAAQPDEPSLWEYWEPQYKSEDKSPFGFFAEYGQDRLTGQSQLYSRNHRFSVRYDNGVDEFKFEADGSFIKSLNYVIDDRKHTYTGYDRYLGKRTWLFLLNDWENNEPIGLKYSQLTGGGLKYDILRNGFWKFNAGLAYLKRVKKQINQSYDQNGLLVLTEKASDDKVLSYRFKFSLNTEKFRFDALAFYQPVMGKKFDEVTGKSVDDYSVSTDFGISYFVSEKLYFRLGHYYKYEAIRFAPDREKWQQRNYLSLGYEI